MVGDDLVSALLAVDGVAAAAVEPQDGGPGTLRLELVPGSDEVAVAGAVNRLLRARFGLAVDADRVQVVEHSTAPHSAIEHALVEHSVLDRGTSAVVTEAAPAPPAAVKRPRVQVGRAGRLAIAQVQVLADAAGVAVTVRLARDESSYAGEALGAATPEGTQWAVAEATLGAVSQVVAGAARFDVDHVELARLGDEPTAVVLVTMLSGRGAQRLTGASVVRDDERRAVVRAVLAAVNRRVEALLADHDDDPDPAAPAARPAVAEES
jgi:hypothetical protein